MPLDIDIGDASPVPLSDTETALLRFLAAHREQAYTPAELASLTTVSTERVPAVLTALAENHLVARADEDRYYATPEGVVAVFPRRLESLGDLVTGNWFDRRRE